LHTQRQAARARLEEKLAKEANGVDILAEVSAARAMARFKEEDLPVNPVTIRPQGYIPTKAMSEAEEFLKHIEVPRASSRVTSLEVASGGMHAVTRGRYEYLNDFIDSMEVKEEERRPMTKREIQRAQKFFRTSSGASKTIGGAFAAGTALCVGAFAATWWYTKATMKVSPIPPPIAGIALASLRFRTQACLCLARFRQVKDSKEYADKMREIVPEKKGSINRSVSGNVQAIKRRVTGWVDAGKSQFDRPVVPETPK
jgi:hypothetical protein